MPPRQDKEWQFLLTLAESSLLLETLIEQPFRLVFELIGKLNHQAQQFYATPNAAQTRQPFSLTTAEVSFCIDALGGLPWNRVNGLLASLHAQLQGQQALEKDVSDGR